LGGRTANAIIDAKKRETEAANVRDVENLILTLKAQKSRHTDEVNNLCLLDARLQRVRSQKAVMRRHA